MLVDRESQGSVLTQCMIGVDYVNASVSFEHNRKMRTCFTATIAELRRGQALQLQDVGIDDRTSYLNDKGTNYFGIVKLQTITGRVL